MPRLSCSSQPSAFPTCKIKKVNCDLTSIFEEKSHSEIWLGERHGPKSWSISLWSTPAPCVRVPIGNCEFWLDANIDPVWIVLLLDLHKLGWYLVTSYSFCMLAWASHSSRWNIKYPFLFLHLLDPADIGIEHLCHSIVVVVVDIQPCFNGQTSVPDVISFQFRSNLGCLFLGYLIQW